MNKHTPGPWMLSLSGPTVYALHGETLRNRFSATAQGGQSDDAGPDELRANAVLMRAAPELLEAVAAFIKYDDGDYIDGTEMMFLYNDAINKAREGFAKATWESQ